MLSYFGVRGFLNTGQTLEQVEGLIDRLHNPTAPPCPVEAGKRKIQEAKIGRKVRIVKAVASFNSWVLLKAIIPVAQMSPSYTKELLTEAEELGYVQKRKGAKGTSLEYIITKEGIDYVTREEAIAASKCSA